MKRLKQRRQFREAQHENFRKGCLLSAFTAGQRLGGHQFKIKYNWIRFYKY